ncbi:MAG: hypothetical protein ACOX87_03510 [Chloroflexota bacterium]|jgi:hypothetical protein
MGEAESYGAQGGARRHDREMAAQARLAWEKVQAVVQRRERAIPSPAAVLRIIDQVPAEGYLGSLAASFLVSLVLDATNHRRAGAFTGIWLPLCLAAALFVKTLRQSGGLKRVVSGE